MWCHFGGIGTGGVGGGGGGGGGGGDGGIDSSCIKEMNKWTHASRFSV